MSLKEQLKYASQETIGLKKLVELWVEETGEDQTTVFRFVTYLLRKDPHSFVFYESDSRDAVSLVLAKRLAEKQIGGPQEQFDKQSRLSEMFKQGIQKAQHCTVRRSVIVGLIKDESAHIPNFLLPPLSRSNAKTTVPTSPPSKTEQNRSATQARYANWQSLADGLRAKNPTASKSWIAKQIEKTPDAEDRDWDTIRNKIDV